MGSAATGRKSIETGDSCQLREMQNPYSDHLGAEKNEIEPENAYAWDSSLKNTGCYLGPTRRRPDDEKL
jgi:hypothetical protein